MLTNMFVLNIFMQRTQILR